MRKLAFVFAARRARFSRSARRAAQAGFTLVEMLVVITIIGLIVALVGPRVLGYLGESKVKAAKIQIESFSAALDLYYLDNGRYPASNEGLSALVQRPASASAWNGPYLRTGAVPLDPWGHPYIYKFPGDHAAYDIASRGPAGEAAGAESTMIKSASQ
jgi:general secretion pathway protein G